MCEAKVKSDKGEVLICFAVNEEAADFSNRVKNPSRVRILITGMGKRNAERAIRRALGEFTPRLVVSCGFAGGLDPTLESGSVIFDAANDARLTALLVNAGAQQARFCCAERVAVTAEEKRALRQSTGADAVEMESEAIGAICREQGIPFATVRVILDTAHEDLPLDFNRLMTAEQQMDYGKLAGALVRSPGKIGALLKLQRQSQAAARSLAQKLLQVLRDH